MRNVLLFCPVKGSLPVWQTRNLVDISRTKFEGVNLKIRFLEGAPIQQARNEGVQIARDEKCVEIVQVDSDLNLGPKELAQLLSHDESVVCALYCHRSLETKWMVTPNNPPSPNRGDGLMAVKQSAIGCSKIKLSVFDKLQADNPDRSGVLTDRAGGSKSVWDFFAFERVGLNTAESRLKSIEAVLRRKVDCRLPDDDKAQLLEIDNIVSTTYLADNLHVSEDYRFCQLCEKSGIPIHVDTGLIVQHATEVMLPIPTAQLYDLLQESWRQEEVNQLNGSNN